MCYDKVKGRALWHEKKNIIRQKRNRLNSLVAYAEQNARVGGIIHIRVNRNLVETVAVTSVIRQR